MEGACRGMPLLFGSTIRMTGLDPMRSHHALRSLLVWLLGWISLVAIGPAAAAQDAAIGDTLALDEAIRLALDRNYEARIARNDVDIAVNDHSVSNADFWPTVSASAGYNETVSNTTQQFIEGPAQDRTGARSTRQNAGAELQWTLFDGLGRFATYHRLGAELQQERARAQGRIEAVLSDVIVTYYDVARQQQQLQVFEEAVEISRERLRIARLRRDLGSASDLEVRQAEIDLNADRAEVLRQEVTLSNTKATLNQLLARQEASTAFRVTEEIDVERTLRQNALLQTAEQRNAALQQARRAIRATELERREIRAERLPSLDATLGYGYSKLEAESGFLQSNRSHDFSYGLSLSFDVFNGFNRRRRLENAAVRIRNAELAAQDVRARLTADLTSAYKNYQNRLTLIELEQQNLEIAQQNVDVALERFRLGEITSVELREVQEQLIQAESRLLTAQFEAKQAETTLFQLSGQLVERTTGQPADVYLGR